MEPTTLFVLWTFVILNHISGISPTVYSLSNTCTQDQQMSVWSSMLQCEPRPTLIEMSLPVTGSASGTAMQIIPGHLMVNRCAGSCSHSPTHSCLPTQINNRSIEVMVVHTTYSSGQWNTMCALVSVEEHQQCQCSCQVTAAQCNSRQRYDSATCSCRCQDHEAQARCLGSGKHWNSETCSCVCQPQTWRTCSTGFIFDYRNTCSCVRTYAMASGGLTLMVGVVALVLVTVGAVIFRYKGRQESLRHSSSVDTEDQLSQALSRRTGEE